MGYLIDYENPDSICFMDGKYVPLKLDCGFKKYLHVDAMRTGHFFRKTDTKINGLDLWEEVAVFENVPLCPALDLEFVREFQQKTGTNLYK